MGTSLIWLELIERPVLEIKSDASTKGVNSRSVIWANQKTEYFVYHWLHAHAMFDVTCFSESVRASNVISRVMSMRLLLQANL